MALSSYLLPGDERDAGREAARLILKPAHCLSLLQNGKLMRAQSINHFPAYGSRYHLPSTRKSQRLQPGAKQPQENSSEG